MMKIEGKKKKKIKTHFPKDRKSRKKWNTNPACMSSFVKLPAPSPNS